MRSNMKSDGAEGDVRAVSELAARIVSLIGGLLGDGAAFGADATRRTFADLGLNSLRGAALAEQLTRLGHAVAPPDLYIHPTPESLARRLVSGAGQSGPARVDAGPRASGEARPVAVVGIGCRLPGIEGPDAFFRLLTEGRQLIAPMSEHRRQLMADWGWPVAEAQSEGRLLEGGFFDRIDAFDAGFFGITEEEAVAMDPQQRLLLECTYDALRDAGVPARSWAGRAVGVYVGLCSGDYGAAQLGELAQVGLFTASGASASIAANRISYAFDFHGPSMVIDTACSSSLVAAQLASEAIARGEIDAAIVGGANVILSPAVSLNFWKAGLLSPGARCKSFDKDADGYVRGEGAGVIVLRSLEAARRDGDRVYAVIQGASSNHGGRGNGLLAPSGRGQERTITEAARRAGVHPADLDYIEAHGTGTFVGDPVEARALGAFLTSDALQSGKRCWLGSVKSNIGHLEAAAGIAGLIKTSLGLYHRVLPPTLNFGAANPQIDFAGLKLRPVTERRAWPGKPGRGCAGVSSVGFGGSNCHLILAEDPARLPENGAPAASDGVARATATGDAGPLLLLLSARSPASLSGMIEAYARALEALAGAPDAEARTRALCHASALGTDHFAERLAVSANGREELLERLRFRAAEPALGPRPARAAERVAFVFPGQGGQWLGMGGELLAQSAAFRGVVEACDRLLLAENARPASAVFRAPEEADFLDISIIQPTLFVYQVGLCAVLAESGVTPDVVVGHSMGEVAAACVSGRLSLADAVRVITRRSRLMRRVSGQGRMCLVAAGPDQIAAALGGALDGEVEVAAFNAPELTVLSGTTRAVEAATMALVARGTFVRDVRVDVASHSRLVDVLAHELRSELADLEPARGELEMYSTVTAARLDGMALDADYWFRNLRQPVRFAEAVAALAAEAPTVFVEISPHPVLCKCIDACKSGAADGRVRSVATALRDASELGSVGEALGRLYELGRELDWDALAPAGTRLGPRPAYAWDRKAYWLQRSARTAAPRAGVAAHPLLGAHVESSLRAGEHLWEAVVGDAALSSFGEHTVEQHPVLPAVAHLELVASAYRELHPGAAPALAEVEVARPLSLARTGATLQLVLRPDPALPSGALRFVVSARHGDAPWQVQCTGSVGPALAAPAGAPEPPARPAREWSSEAYYETLAALHLTYGSAYRTLTSVAADGDAAWGRLRDARPGAHLLDPAVLDGALQLALACAAPAGVGAGEVIVPIGFERVGFWPERGAPAGALTAVARARGDGELGFDVWLSRAGEVVAHFEGVRCRRTVRALFQASMSRSRDELALRVRWLEQPSLPPLHAARRSVAVYADDGELATRLSGRLAAAGARVERRPLAAEPDSPRPEALAAELIVVVASAAAGRRDELFVLELAQRLARGDAARPPQLCVIVPYALGVLPPAADGASPPPADGGGVWGLVRTLRAESPRLSPRIIAALDPQLPRLEEALVRELLHAPPAPEVLLASGARFTPRLCPLERLPAAPRERGFDPDGIHLLVGGAGGIGAAVVARWLAGGARRFAVVGRSSGQDTRVVALTRQVEAAGGALAYVQADASTPEGAACLAGWLHSQQARVAGVMLLAGYLDDAPFEALSPERYLRQHASKATLAQQLDALLDPARLDYFVLFSSLSGVLGSAGQAHYAAANSALDAFAAQRLARGRRTLSIAWGPWAEVGMVADETHRQALTQRGITPLATAEAVELLVALLGSGVEGQITVAALDRALAGARAGASPLLADGAAPREAAAPAPATTTGLPEGGDLDALRGWIGKHLGHALRSPVGPRDYERPFNSLGLQSLQLLELKIKLEGQLGIFLSASSIWKQPTVTGLASLIHAKLQRRAP